MHVADDRPDSWLALRPVAAFALILTVALGAVSNVLFLAAFRVRREWFDDPALLVAGGSRSGELLRWAVGEVQTREGAPPDRVAVCHPANWGAYKRELLDNAIRQANLGNAIMLTEPEAAAIHYSSTERVETGVFTVTKDNVSQFKRT
jgi:hypothetical protein